MRHELIRFKHSEEWLLASFQVRSHAIVAAQAIAKTAALADGEYLGLCYDNNYDPYWKWVDEKETQT